MVIRVFEILDGLSLLENADTQRKSTQLRGMGQDPTTHFITECCKGTTGLATVHGLITDIENI